VQKYKISGRRKKTLRKSSLLLAIYPGPPCHFRYLKQMSSITGKHKKIITKPVQVFDNQWIYKKLFFVKMNCNTLSSSANTTANMNG
jgi:hypothetical protein